MRNIIFAFAVIVSGFLISSPALAAHTANVSVNPVLVRGASSKSYTFLIGNNASSSNFIYYIGITAPEGFTITGGLSCPDDWLSSSTANNAACTGNSDPQEGLGIQSGDVAEVSFTATAPAFDSVAPWIVQTQDDADDSQLNYPVTIVDATPPTISSYTLNDIAASVSFNPNTASVEITIDASEAVKFTRIYICAISDDVCNDGTAMKWFFQNTFNTTFMDVWNGTYRNTGVVVADGVYKLKVNIKDEAGNTNQGIDLTPYFITVDTIAPNAVITSTVSFPTNITPIPITVNFSEPVTGFELADIVLVNGTADNLGGANAIYTFDLTPFDQGLVTINIMGSVAQDGAGNGNIFAEQFSIIFDSIPPSVDAGSDKIVNVPVFQNATVSETGSGIASYSWEKISGPGNIAFGAPSEEDTLISANTDGIYIIQLTVIDNAGNTNFDTMKLIWDTIAPLVEITSPRAGQVVNGGKKIEFTDDDLVAPQCSIDGINWVDCVSDMTELGQLPGFNVLPNGPFTLYLKDTDAAGNVGSDSEIGIIKDSRVPKISSRSPNRFFNLKQQLR